MMIEIIRSNDFRQAKTGLKQNKRYIQIVDIGAFN
jgi:hypothetical protein